MLHDHANSIVGWTLIADNWRSTCSDAVSSSRRHQQLVRVKMMAGENTEKFIMTMDMQAEKIIMTTNMPAQKIILTKKMSAGEKMMKQKTVVGEKTRTSRPG